VTTASDIFVLGIILHELVTGAHPFDAVREGESTPAIDVLRRICEEEPRKPREYSGKGRGGGRICRPLGGDLQSIILKALQKMPTDRYRSVEYFIDDIQNLLERRPVLARPQSWWYRTRNWSGDIRLQPSQVRWQSLLELLHLDSHSLQIGQFGANATMHYNSGSSLLLRRAP
jgi:serine/threonine-protein kinase